MEKWFDTSKIIYDDGVRLGKPHPDIYLEALKVMDLKAEETLVFEDSYSGITAANEAKIGKIIAIASLEPIEFYKNIIKSILHIR